MQIILFIRLIFVKVFLKQNVFDKTILVLKTGRFINKTYFIKIAVASLSFNIVFSTPTQNELCNIR